MGWGEGRSGVHVYLNNVVDGHEVPDLPRHDVARATRARGVVLHHHNHNVIIRPCCAKSRPELLSAFDIKTIMINTNIYCECLRILAVRC